MENKNIILVLGIPGSGKTTFANKLSAEMAGIPVVSTDIVKAVYEEESINILSKVSYNAWQIVGEYTDENIVTGYKIFSSELFKYSYALAKKLLRTYNTVIIEGLGIDVSVISDLPESIITVLLTNSNRQAGYLNKLFYRNNKENNWQKNEHALELINKYIESNLSSEFMYYKFDVSESDMYIKRINGVVLEYRHCGCGLWEVEQQAF